MAKAKITDTVKELEIQAKELFELIKKTQGEVSSLLQSARRSESELRAKEEHEEKLRKEEEQKRLFEELLKADTPLAVQVGGEESAAKVEEEPAPAQENKEEKQEEKEEAQPEKAEEPVAAEAENAKSAKEPEEPDNKPAERRPVQCQVCSPQ